MVKENFKYNVDKEAEEWLAETRQDELIQKRDQLKKAQNNCNQVYDFQDEEAPVLVDLNSSGISL